MDKTFSELQQLPVSFEYYIPKPCRYPRDSSSIIISTDRFEGNPGIFRYDIETNEMKKMLQYDKDAHFEYHCQFIDYIHKIIFETKSKFVGENTNPSLYQSHSYEILLPFSHLK